MGADISVEAVAGKLNRIGYETFLQGSGRPRARAIAISSSPTGCCTCCSATAPDLAVTADHYKIARAKLIADATAAANGFRRT